MIAPPATFVIDCPRCGMRRSDRSDAGVWEYEGGEGISYTLTPAAQACPICLYRMVPGDWFTIVTPYGRTTYAIPRCGCGDRTDIVTTMPGSDGRRHIPTCPYASMRESA